MVQRKGGGPAVLPSQATSSSGVDAKPAGASQAGTPNGSKRRCGSPTPAAFTAGVVIWARAAAQYLGRCSSLALSATPSGVRLQAPTDAALVWLADDSGLRRILTVDRSDFSLFRLKGGKRFDVLDWF